MVPTFLIPGYAGGLRGGRNHHHHQRTDGTAATDLNGANNGTSTGTGSSLRPTLGHHGYPGEDSSGFGEDEEAVYNDDDDDTREDQLRRLVPVIPKIEVQVVGNYAAASGAPYQPLRELDAHYNEAYAAGYHQYDYDTVYGESSQPYPSVVMEPVQICYDPTTGQTVLVESEELVVAYRRGSGSNLPVIHESGKEDDDNDDLVAPGAKETAILSDESDSVSGGSGSHKDAKRLLDNDESVDSELGAYANYKGAHGPNSDYGSHNNHGHHDDDDQYYSPDEDYHANYDDYQSSAESDTSLRTGSDDVKGYPAETPQSDDEEQVVEEPEVDLDEEETEEEEDDDIDAYFNLSQEEFQLLSSARESVKASRSKHGDPMVSPKPSPKPSRHNDLAAPKQHYQQQQQPPRSPKLERNHNNSQITSNNVIKDHCDRRKASGSDSVISASNFTHTESVPSNSEMMSTGTGTYSSSHSPLSPRDFPRDYPADLASPRSRDYSDLYSPRGISPRDFVPSRSLSLETPSDLWRDNSSTHESISVISSRLEELEKLEREREEKEKQEKERLEQEEKEKQQQEQQQQQQDEKPETSASLLRPQDAAKPSLMKQHSLKETITGVVTGIRGFIVDSISSEDIHASTKDEPEFKEEPKESTSGEEEKPNEGQSQAGAVAREPEGASQGAGIIKGAPSGKKFLTAVNRVAKLRQSQKDKLKDGEEVVNITVLTFILQEHYTFIHSLLLWCLHVAFFL